MRNLRWGGVQRLLAELRSVPTRAEQSAGCCVNRADWVLDAPARLEPVESLTQCKPDPKPAAPLAHRNRRDGHSIHRRAALPGKPAYEASFSADSIIVTSTVRSARVKWIYASLSTTAQLTPRRCRLGVRPCPRLGLLDLVADALVITWVRRAVVRPAGRRRGALGRCRPRTPNCCWLGRSRIRRC